MDMSVYPSCPFMMSNLLRMSNMTTLAPSPYLKAYLIFLAIDAMATVIDFSKKNIDDGIVDGSLN
jgi:hypothetical protein